MTSINEPLLDAVPTPATAPETAPIKFSVTASTIARMKNEAAKLAIADVDDKAGFTQVYEFRQAVRRQRLAVQNKQKELKAPHTAYNRQVDEVATLLIDPMKEIEADLLRKEDWFTAERERIAREKELALQQRTESRVNQLRSYGFTWNRNSESYELSNEQGLFMHVLFDDIKNLPDEEIAHTLSLAKQLGEEEQARQAEVKRLADEAAAQLKAEQDRLAKERQDLERLKAELAEQQAKLQQPTTQTPEGPTESLELRGLSELPIEETEQVPKHWTYEVVNEIEVPAAYKIIDDRRVRMAIRDGKREIPGLRIFEESVKTVD